MGHTHTYRTSLNWTGSTGAGYETYDRTHRLVAPPAETELVLSADRAFRGDEASLNPEQLLLAAASSCQLLSFLAIAGRARLDVQAYSDEAEAVMPADDKPLRIVRIHLRPHVVVGAGAEEQRTRRLLELAHDECFIANSLTSEIVLEPTIEILADEPRRPATATTKKG